MVARVLLFLMTVTGLAHYLWFIRILSFYSLVEFLTAKVSYCLVIHKYSRSITKQTVLVNAVSLKLEKF